MKFNKFKRINPEQVRLGIAIEREHASTIKYIKKYQEKFGTLPPNKKIYKYISLNHLREDPNYYTKLKKLRL